jgi:hypothetical protein
MGLKTEWTERVDTASLRLPSKRITCSWLAQTMAPIDGDIAESSSTSSSSAATTQGVDLN